MQICNMAILEIVCVLLVDTGQEKKIIQLEFGSHNNQGAGAIPPGHPFYQCKSSSWQVVI